MDAGGSTHGIDARFSIEQEQPAFPIHENACQILCDTTLAAPLKSLVDGFTEAL